MEERVQKILSNAGITSRRKAEELIEQGKVLVNGKPIKLGAKANISKDTIIVDGKVVTYTKKRYIMLNKPRGYVTTLEDQFEKRIITDLIKIPERVYPVGRLDKDTEGLLLLTNDGDFANSIMHPKYEIQKTYHVVVDKELQEEDLEEIEQGIVIDDRKTTPAKVKQLSSQELEITIHEGRNRIVRRMMEALGYTVQELVRVKVGKLGLGDLKVGKYRDLSEKEIERIFQ